MAQDKLCAAPDYKAECERLTADLCRQADEVRKAEGENHALRTLLAEQERQTAILSAQMDVVRMIFSGGNR